MSLLRSMTQGNVCQQLVVSVSKHKRHYLPSFTPSVGSVVSSLFSCAGASGSSVAWSLFLRPVLDQMLLTKSIASKARESTVSEACALRRVCANSGLLQPRATATTTSSQYPHKSNSTRSTQLPSGLVHSLQTRLELGSSSGLPIHLLELSCSSHTRTRRYTQTHILDSSASDSVTLAATSFQSSFIHLLSLSPRHSSSEENISSAHSMRATLCLNFPLNKLYLSLDL